MPNIIHPIIVFIVITLQMLLLGLAVSQVLGIWRQEHEVSRNLWMKVFFGLSIGFAFDTALLFILGAASSLTTPASISILTGTTLVASLQLKQRFSLQLQFSHILPIVSALALYVILILLAIHPPGTWDDTMYHLPLARFYLEQHQFTLQPYLRFPLFPQNMHILFTLGLMLGDQGGGDILVQLIATLPVYITCLGLIGVMLWKTGSAWPGFVAATLLLKLRPITGTLGYAYIDNGLGLYCWAALLAITCSFVQEDKGWRRPWLIIAGLMAGMAMGTKLFGVVFIIFPSLWLLAARRDWCATLVYSGTVLIFGCWWYIRAWLISGDPIHPFGGNLFGHFLWNAQDLINSQQEQSMHGVSKNISNLWASLKKADVILFSIVPFSLIYWRRLKPDLTLILGTTAGYFTFWFYVTQVDRYLAPIIAPAVFLAIWSLWQMAQTVLRHIPILTDIRNAHSKTIGAVLCAVPLIITARDANWYIHHRIHQHWNNIFAWNEILEQRPGYSLMQRANQLIPQYGNRLLNAGFENAIYYYQGIVIGDWFGSGRYSQLFMPDDSCHDQVTPCDHIIPLVSAQSMQLIMNKHQAHTLIVNLNRFKIDQAAYQKMFIIQQITPEGILLTLQ